MVMSFDLDVDLLAGFQPTTSTSRTRYQQGEDLGQVDRMVPGHTPAKRARRNPLLRRRLLACSEKLGTETGAQALVIITDAEDFGSKVRWKRPSRRLRGPTRLCTFCSCTDPGAGWRPMSRKSFPTNRRPHHRGLFREKSSKQASTRFPRSSAANTRSAY